MGILRNVTHTMASAYEEILAGERPWVALGNFMNDWFMYNPHRREELVAEPPAVPEQPTEEEWRWAVFSAASVEYLCQRYALPCPQWVHEREYSLSTPWYHVVRLHPAARTRLRRTTPEQFKRRNIFCGDRVYLDKREILATPADFLAMPPNPYRTP